jgi:hypothetical protein
VLIRRSRRTGAVCVPLSRCLQINELGASQSRLRSVQRVPLAILRRLLSRYQSVEQREENVPSRNPRFALVHGRLIASRCGKLIEPSAGSLPTEVIQHRQNHRGQSKNPHPLTDLRVIWAKGEIQVYTFATHVFRPASRSTIRCRSSRSRKARPSISMGCDFGPNTRIRVTTREE